MTGFKEILTALASKAGEAVDRFDGQSGPKRVSQISEAQRDLYKEVAKYGQGMSVGWDGGISGHIGLSAMPSYYGGALSGNLYPSLYMGELGRSYGVRSTPSLRQVERMLKCSACGVQYLLREAAEKVDNSPLVKLQCTSCGGDLEMK